MQEQGLTELGRKNTFWAYVSCAVTGGPYNKKSSRLNGGGSQSRLEYDM